MPTQLQFRRGNTAQTSTFTGVVAEITVNTQENSIIVHDGSTPGGHPAATFTFAKAAFDVANSASIGGTSSAVYANGAFVQANAAFAHANSGHGVANSASIYANGAFIQANAAFNHANAAYESQNTTGSYANSAYLEANTAYTAAVNATNFVTSVNIYSYGAFTQANAAFDKANSAGNYANGAFAQANAAYNHANTKYSSSGGTISGDVIITGNTTPTTDNVYTLGTPSNRWKSIYVGPGSVYVGNTVLGETGNVLVISGVTDIVLPNSNVPASTIVSDAANSAGLYANAAFAHANASFAAANNVFPQIQPSFNTANAAFVQANSAYESQNTTGTYANAAFYTANSASSYANGAFAQANAAFDKANNSIQNSGVNSINGSLTVSNSGGTALVVSGNAVFQNDISISGNVYIGGNATSFGANNIVLEDSMVYLANNNSANTLDIGLIGNIVDGTYQHLGMVRDASDGTWKFFSNVESEPTTTVDFTYAIYEPIKVGEVIADAAKINGINLLPYAQASFGHANAAYASQNVTGTYANTAFDTANSASVYANGSFAQANAAFDKANGAVQTGFTTISANGNSITPSSNADTFTITAAVANGINILNPSSKTIDIGLRVSGVSSGWYGGSTQIPSINVDEFGRITSIANNSVSTTINLAGGSGSGSVAGGGTLTVSGGTGITTSVSGSTITVTNSGVTSFNGATGVITFGSANVTNALGYTPANKAGDAFTGAISSSGAIIGASLTANTGVTVNTNGNITSSSFTTTASTAQVTVDSFATTTYRSAKYEVQVNTASAYHVIELRVVHDGTTVWLAQYGEVFTGSSLGTFDASISAGNLNLLFTPDSATITTVKTIRNAITV